MKLSQKSCFSIRVTSRMQQSKTCNEIVFTIRRKSLQICDDNQLKTFFYALFYSTETGNVKTSCFARGDLDPRVKHPSELERRALRREPAVKVRDLLVLRDVVDVQLHLSQRFNKNDPKSWLGIPSFLCQIWQHFLTISFLS